MDDDNTLQEEIKRIEEGAKKKEKYIIDRINQEHDPKIKEIESKLTNIRTEFNQIDEVLKEWAIKEKEAKKRQRELYLAAQPLKKELKKLNEEKLKILKKELEAIRKEETIRKKAVEK